MQAADDGFAQQRGDDGGGASAAEPNYCICQRPSYGMSSLIPLKLRGRSSSALCGCIMPAPHCALPCRGDDWLRQHQLFIRVVPPRLRRHQRGEHVWTLVSTPSPVASAAAVTPPHAHPRQIRHAETERPLVLPHVPAIDAQQKEKCGWATTLRQRGINVC